MRILGLLLAIGMICGFAESSFAQKNYRRGGINQRQARQQKRIENGVQNGSLTPRETQRLERREGRISDLEAKDRATNGGLSPREKGELERDLNKESRDIYQQKHDGQGTNLNQRNVNERQANQTERIENGVQNGSLTAQETYRLERQEARISDLEAKDRASGGRLSASERAELNGLLNSESHRIYVQKHDSQTVPKP